LPYLNVISGRSAKEILQAGLQIQIVIRSKSMLFYPDAEIHIYVNIHFQTSELMIFAYKITCFWKE